MYTEMEKKKKLKNKTNGEDISNSGIRKLNVVINSPSINRVNELPIKIPGF